MVKEDNIIFGLDIGTRNVVGIVAKKEDDKLSILDWELLEHEPRAMIDGQIHDIMKVSDSIGKVKKTLEERQNISLKEVSIAAAGRVLKTITTKAYLDFEEEQYIEKHHIQSLELTGIDKAQKSIQKQVEGDFFCVGYNVVTYYLNNYEMENLEAHKAKRIGIEILATFLPQVVIDSLYTSVDREGLSVDHLSLEPIAAINAAIPKSYRLLNLALVDIGAGTSDIAITKGGSVMAYGMIPMAGDEMTEQLIHKYLVDFKTAEKMKIAISKEEMVSYKDILGTNHEVNYKTALKYIKPVIDSITTAIADEIIALNGNQSPNAVFCVGGGGQIKGFTALLAKKLGLPRERVVLKGMKDLLNVEFQCKPFQDPSMVTPVGICLTSMESQRENFCEIIINERKVKLLNARELTVLDAALKYGYDYHNLIARKGKDLNFKINNKRIRKRGNLGEAAEIYVNNKDANLHTTINEGDFIVIKKAINGENATATLIEYVDNNPYYIINGYKTEIQIPIYANEKLIDTEYVIKNQDEIVYDEILTLEDLSRHSDISLEESFYINGIKADVYSSRLKSGDDIEFGTDEEDQYIEDLNAAEEVAYGQETSLSPSTIANGHIEYQVEVNGDTVLLHGKKDYIFVDIFEFYPFNLANPKGKIKLKLNGKDAAYTDQLSPNDRLDIYWE